jgi:glycosyl transferase family 25
MKTFAITLERAKERKKYIQKHLSDLDLDYEIVYGVDGRKLTDQDIEKYADKEAIKRSPHWLNPGAIGCALSHLSIYKKIIDQNLDYAFIVEDDIVLPENIKEIIEFTKLHLKDGEPVLLYYASFKPCSFSTHQAILSPEKKYGLYYPMNYSQPITTGAYFLNRKTAKALAGGILPVRVAADAWGYFIKQNIISSLRCVYPLATEIKNFKSSIDYIDHKSLKGRLLDFVNNYKVPVLHQLLSWLRKRKAITGNSEFSLINEKPDWVKHN